jgi:pilus assembly protein CpaF
MEGQTITMQELFRFEAKGVTAEGRIYGEMKGTGIISRHLDKFKRMGSPVPTDVFQSAMEI